MPRHKKDYLSDGLDSDESGSGASDGYNSQEDNDSRAERALFEHNGAKRRKMQGGRGKAAAWEGIFGEDEPVGGRQKGKARTNRTDWTKPPAFVSKSQQADPLPGNDEPGASTDQVLNGQDHDNDEDDEDEDGDSDDSDDSTRPPSPRVRDEEEDGQDDQPQRGGIGGAKSSLPPGFGFQASRDADQPDLKEPARGGLGTAKRGGRGGIGSTRPVTSEAAVESSRAGLGSANAPSVSEPEVPTAFGRTRPTAESSQRPLQRFVKRAALSGTSTPIELSTNDATALRKIQGSYGAKLLAGLGWAPGKGLGANEDGRAVPVQVGKLMRGQGIQKGIRTEDSIAEAIRKGLLQPEEEEETKPRGSKNKGGRAGQSQPSQSWKKQPKVKVKVQHKTYEQLLAEAGDSVPGVGLVLDARSGDLKEVSSLSTLSLSSWTPTSDKMQLPELRHNLRLIVDAAKGDVEALVKEGRSVHDRRRWAVREEELSRAKADNAQTRIARLQQIQRLVSEIAQEASAQADMGAGSLDSLASDFENLLRDHKTEYRALKLDEVVVGAIAQVLRPVFAAWHPFDVSSDILLTSLKRWKDAYNLRGSSDGALVASNGASLSMSSESGADMSAWESLMWNLWLPKVRSTINNEWDASKPFPAVHLLESWSPILPHFIRDNILDQLILPKVKAAVERWGSRRGEGSTSLANLVFPWLPLLGERMEEVLEDAKRRIRHVLKNWVVKDGAPAELAKWRKEIYSSHEWDKLMLNYVVPKLGASLRNDFVINPRKQDMAPLSEWVMPWHSLLRSSVFTQLLEVNFFPKWLDTLYVWLSHPGYSPDEVADWFTWWKKRFPEEVANMRGISHGFNQGLQLMEEAMRLGESASTCLKKPVFKPLPSSQSGKAAKPAKPRPVVDQTPQEITFRSLVEEQATQNDLILLPVGRSHTQTGKPLFKITRSIDGKGGLTVYIGDNAVFAQMEDGTYRAVSLDDMVKRALS